MDAKNLINGTFGTVWLNDDQVSECKGLQAKIEFTKEDVNLPGQLGTDTKVVGWKGTGSLKLYKTNSRMVKVLESLFNDGKDVRFSVISKLADPDALGVERIKIKNVSFDDLTLADWETAKYGEVECPFTFNAYEMIDSI